MAHIKNVRIRLRPLTVCKHTNVKYYYEPDAYGHDTHIHAVDTDTMCGILDTHAANTMNQIPMEPIPNFVDGNFICKWYQLSAVEKSVITC